MLSLSHRMGAVLASASRDHTVRFWDPATGAEKAIIDGHIEWINSVAFSPDSSLIASGSHDETLRLWDMSTYTESQTFSGHEYLMMTLPFHRMARSSPVQVRMNGFSCGM